MESTDDLTVEAIILGLGAYLFPVDWLSKQKRTMHRGISKLCVIKECATQIIWFDLTSTWVCFLGGN